MLEDFFDRRDEEVFDHVHLVEVGEGFVPVFNSDMFYFLSDFLEIFRDFLYFFGLVCLFLVGE